MSLLLILNSLSFLTRISHSWSQEVHSVPLNTNPAGNYMFKVNNRSTRTRCEIWSKLTIKTPEQRQWRCSGVFIVNFEHISHLVLVFLNFEQVNAGYVNLSKLILFKKKFWDKNQQDSENHNFVENL